MKIEELNFSCRTYNCLKRSHIDTVEQLLTMSDDDLMRLRYFGVGCLQEVHEKTGKPTVAGPSGDNQNIMELCFHNGEQNMKEKIIGRLRSIADLVWIMRKIARWAGFEITNRVEFRHRVSGRQYR